MNQLVDLLLSVLIDPALLAVAAASSALMLTGTAARVIDVVERRPIRFRRTADAGTARES